MASVVTSKSIQIAGGGIAGLTAAIQLKKYGFDPIVFEKDLQIGGSRHGDYEGLENWIFSQHAPSFMDDSGFNFNTITTHPINHFLVHTQNYQPLLIQSKNPFFYMVKRGSKKDDLDNQLYRQCVDQDIQFKLGKKAPKFCHINATGTKKAAAYIQGINFSTRLKDQIHLLLGHKYAPKGYAYLIIIGGEGTLAAAFKKPKNFKMDYLKETQKYFNTKGIQIRNGKQFASRGSFSLSFLAWKPPFQIGEAGGFQDYLFGFGIRMSIMSGRAAALSVIGEKKEARKILIQLNQKRRLSFINRILYERLNDYQMAVLAKKLYESSNPLSILSGAYDWNFKNMLRWINMRYRYEIRPT